MAVFLAFEAAQRVGNVWLDRDPQVTGCDMFWRMWRCKRQYHSVGTTSAISIPEDEGLAADDRPPVSSDDTVSNPLPPGDEGLAADDQLPVSSDDTVSNPLPLISQINNAVTSDPQSSTAKCAAAEDIDFSVSRMSESTYCVSPSVSDDEEIPVTVELPALHCAQNLGRSSLPQANKNNMNKSRIHVSSKNEDSKVQNRQLLCFFCDKFFFHMIRHIQRQHDDEQEVANCMVNSPGNALHL